MKVIEARKNPKNNILWVKKLSARQIHQNIIFQNTFWFIFNVVILSGILILSLHYESYEWQTFWPFTPPSSSRPTNTYKWEEEKVFKLIQCLIPILIFVGVLLMVYTIFEEWPGLAREKKMASQVEDILPTYPGWTHSQCDDDGWHKYTVDGSLDHGLQGRLNQVFYLFVNTWESFIDKGLH